MLFLTVRNQTQLLTSNNSTVISITLSIDTVVQIEGGWFSPELTILISILGTEQYLSSHLFIKTPSCIGVNEKTSILL